MKRRLFFYGLLIASVSALAPLAADKPKESDRDEQKPASIWMRKKLQYAEKILEGLATADYEQLAENADAMSQFSRIEEFVRGRDETYRHHLQNFEHASRQLARQARAENIEGATLAYMELTLSCVKCHEHLRDRERP